MSMLADDYKEPLVRCGKLIHHRVGDCVMFINQLVAIAPDLRAVLKPVVMP